MLQESYCKKLVRELKERKYYIISVVEGTEISEKVASILKYLDKISATKSIYFYYLSFCL